MFLLLPPFWLADGKRERSQVGQRWGRIRCPTQSHLSSRVIKMSKGQINILSSRLCDWRCTGSDERNQNMTTWREGSPDRGADQTSFSSLVNKIWLLPQAPIITRVPEKWTEHQPQRVGHMLHLISCGWAPVSRVSTCEPGELGIGSGNQEVICKKSPKH